MANGDEQAGNRQFALLTSDGVFQDDPSQSLVAMNLGDHRVPGELYLGILERSGGHDLAGPQLITAMHDSHGLGESRKEGRLLNGRVATADHRDVLVTEEKAITRGTPRHTVPGQSILSFKTELAVAGAHGQDHRTRLDVM